MGNRHDQNGICGTVGQRPVSAIVFGTDQRMRARYAGPLFTVLVAHFATRDERISIPKLLGIAFGIVGVAVMIGAGGAGAMQTLSQGGRPPASMLYTIFRVYGVLGLLIFLGGARFALASAQTVAERGIRIFGSWGLTKGRYWKVVGALLLSLITLIPVLCLYIGVLAGVTLATGGELNSLSQPDYSSLAALFDPVAITRYVFGGIFGSLAVVVTGSATAYIYRALAEGTEAPATDDDDDEDWDDED